MKLYVGGAYQGQEELARRENPGAACFFAFHETLRGVIERGEDPQAYARAFARDYPDAVVVADEIGCGVVPVRAEDRAWRDGAGRALCILAQASERGTRGVCGIGTGIQ